MQIRAATSLGFSFISETPISTFAVSAETALGLPLGSDDVEEGLLVEGPELRFSYNRAVPSASLAVVGTLRRRDLSFVSGLGDLLGDDGSIDVPVQFEELEDEGTRRSATLGAVLTLRDDAPLGFEISAEFEAVDYLGVTSPDLADFRRIDYAAVARFDLTEVAQVRARLRGSTLGEDGIGSVTLYGLSIDGSLERPDGRIFATYALDETEDGLLSALAVGRAIERPLGAVEGALGVTRDGDGNFLLTGRLGVRRDFPNGAVSASFEQAVVTDDGDDPALGTSLVVRWDQELTPLTDFSIDGLYRHQEGLDVEEEERYLELGSTLTRKLTRDWSLAVGYRRYFQDESGADPAISDSVFVGLSRTFQSGL